MKWWIVLLLLFVILVYSNTLHHPFIWDDFAIAKGITGQLWHWDYDRPFLQFTYELGARIQNGPEANHVINLALHLGNLILVYLIAIELGFDALPALLGTAVLGIHPLFSEAVATLAGRSSLLCATFYFGAILAWLKLHRVQIVIWPLSIVFLCLLLGWLTKPEIGMVPLVLVLLAWILGYPVQLYLVSAIGCGVVLTPLIWAKLHALNQVTSANSELVNAGFEPVLKLSSYIPYYLTNAIGHYYAMFWLPFSFSPTPRLIQPDWFIILGTIAMLGFAWYFAGPIRSLRCALVCLVVSPILLYTFFPLADPILEHRAYITGLGFVLLVACLIEAAPKLRYALVPLLFVLGTLTTSYNHVWSDPIGLWEYAVQQSPLDTRTHLNLAAAYQAEGYNKKAIPEYELILKLKPTLWTAYSNLGALYLDRAEYSKAQELLDKAIAGAPHFADAWSNHGVLCLRIGKLDSALADFNRALHENPRATMAKENRQVVLDKINERKGS